jgi:hypothetical protein
MLFCQELFSLFLRFFFWGWRGVIPPVPLFLPAGNLLAVERMIVVVFLNLTDFHPSNTHTVAVKAPYLHNSNLLFFGVCSPVF